MNSKIILIVLGLFFTQFSNAQDVHFSQFWNNSVLYNPALAGLMPGTIRVSGNYRNQWFSVASPYQTFGVNFDMLIEGKGNTNFGVGANIFRDVAGDTKMGTTNFQLMFSTIINMDLHNKLSFGIKTGFIQRGFTDADARWNSQYQNGSYDPTAASGENLTLQAGTKADLSIGMGYVYHSTIKNMKPNEAFRAKIGFSYNHVLRPKFNWFAFSDDPIYSNFVFSSEFMFGISGTKWSIEPGLVAQFQGPSKEFILGALYRVSLKQGSQITGFKKGAYMYFGTHIRLKDAFIPSVGFEFNQYSFGLSYDANFSKLRTASKGLGGIEFTFKFNSSNDFLWKNHRYKSRI